MTAVGAKKRAIVRRGNVRLGDVRRGPDGEVTMIQLESYKDNPLAPTALVSKVGGIYRLDTHLIRMTFVDELPNAEGVFEAVAQSHLVWKTEQHWFAMREIFDFAMPFFRRTSPRKQ